MPSQTVTLYSASEVPFIGQVTSRDPASLRDGEWQLAQNVRWSSTSLQARYGFASYRASTGLPAGTVVGADFGVLGDFIAIAVSGSTRIYKYYSGSWQECTSGGSGTRFSSTEPVRFVRFTMPYAGSIATAYLTPNSRDYIVAISNNDYPRIMSLNTGVPTAYSIQAITPPNFEYCTATPKVNDSALLINTGGTAITAGDLTKSPAGAGSDLEATISTSSGYGNSILLTAYSATVANGEYASISLTASSNILIDSNTKQMQIVYSSGAADIWSQLAIQVNVGGSWYYIHHPTYTTPAITSCGDKYYSAAFTMTSWMASGSLGTWSAVSGSSITDIRFEWIGNAPPSNVAVQIYAITVSGGVPYGTEFGVSFWSANQATESPGVVCESKRAPTLKDVNGTPIPNVRLGESYQFTYKYNISYRCTATSYLPLIYASTNAGELVLLNMVPTASTATSGYVDTVAVHSLSFGNWTFPDAQTMEMPRATCGTYNSDRLFLAANIGNSSSASNNVLFSQKGYPTRFRAIPKVEGGQVDPAGAGVASFGSESVKSILALTPGSFGGQAIIVHTDKSCYAMGGLDALQLGRPDVIAPYGTLSPLSVAILRNQLVWVDQEMQVRAYGSSIDGISTRTIENVLTAVPTARIPYVSVGTFRDIMYISYTPSGGSANTKSLVYDLRTGGWSTDSTASSYDFAFWVQSVQSGAPKNLVVSSDGTTLEYEKASQTTDAGSTITVSLTSKEINSGLWNQIRLTDIGIIADDQGAVEWTTTLTGKQGSTQTGAINMDTTSGLAWKWNRGSSDTSERPGLKDVAVSVSITGAMTGGSKIYTIVVKSEEVNENGAVRD